MSGLNKLFFIGNLCADPEVRFTQTGIQVVKIRVATSRATKQEGGGWGKDVDFHTCSVFGQPGTFLATYATKGDQVTLECTLRNNNWADRNGVKHYHQNLIVEKVLSLSAKKGKKDVLTQVAPELPPEMEEYLEPDREELPPEAWEDNGEPE